MSPSEIFNDCEDAKSPTINFNFWARVNAGNPY